MEPTSALFNRPAGTKTLSDPIPALKRRATLRASLWDARDKDPIAGRLFANLLKYLMLAGTR